MFEVNYALAVLIKCKLWCTIDLSVKYKDTQCFPKDMLCLRCKLSIILSKKGLMMHCEMLVYST